MLRFSSSREAFFLANVLTGFSIVGVDSTSLEVDSRLGVLVPSCVGLCSAWSVAASILARINDINAFCSIVFPCGRFAAQALHL